MPFYGYPYQLSTASARLQAMFCQSNLLTAPSLPIAISSPAWLLAFHCAPIERCLLAPCASPGLQLPLASRARNVHLRSRCQRAQLICAGLFQLAVTGIPSLSVPANGTHLSTFTIRTRIPRVLPLPRALGRHAYANSARFCCGKSTFQRLKAQTITLPMAN